MAMFLAAARLLNIGRVCRDEASGDLDLAIGEDQCQGCQGSRIINFGTWFYSKDNQKSIFV